MFSEILKIIPKIETKDLEKMTRTLNDRFQSVAKKFGGGLMSAIKGGGIAGLAIGLIDKVLNPLESVKEAIDKTLNRGDDLSTFAKQFNTTAGNLARLQAFGKATGLDPEGVRLLLGKFQSAVANAAADPSTPTAVSNFVGKKDTAEAFFEFIQAMQGLTATQQNLVQQEVFGQKQILKSSEFLNANFKELNQMMGGPSSESLTAAAEWLGKMSDNRDLFAAQKELTDLPKKAGLIKDSTINGLNAADSLSLLQENKNLAKFQSLEAISIANQKLINVAVNAFLELAPMIAQILPKVAGLVEGTATQVQGVAKSRAARGLVKGKDE